MDKELLKHEEAIEVKFEVWSKLRDGHKKVWCKILSFYTLEDAKENVAMAATSQTAIARITSIREFLKEEG